MVPKSNRKRRVAKATLCKQGHLPPQGKPVTLVNQRCVVPIGSANWRFMARITKAKLRNLKEVILRRSGVIKHLAYTKRRSRNGFPLFIPIIEGEGEALLYMELGFKAQLLDKISDIARTDLADIAKPCQFGQHQTKRNAAEKIRQNDAGDLQIQIHGITG